MAYLAVPFSDVPELTPDQAQRARGAQTEIDSGDEPLFARIQAPLRRFYPDTAEYVFRDLKPARGIDAVHGMATLLTRLDALDKGTDPTRQASRKEDRKAIALLAERGITAEYRERLGKLVSLALGPTEPLPELKLTVDPAERRRCLTELKLWYEDWSQTARALIHKRSQLIRLGLAQSRSPSAAEPDEPAADGDTPEGTSESK